MNYLSKWGEDYPFVFFPEAAFYKEQVSAMIAQAYSEILESKDIEIITPKAIGMMDIYSFTLAKIGRIVKLDENWEDLFFPREFNDYIRALAEEYDGDLIKVTDKFMEGRYISKGNEDSILFEKDVKTVLDRENMFYLNSEYPYDMLAHIHSQVDDGPFTQDNVDKFLRNIPIKRVW